MHLLFLIQTFFIPLTLQLEPVALPIEETSSMQAEELVYSDSDSKSKTPEAKKLQHRPLRPSRPMHQSKPMRKKVQRPINNEAPSIEKKDIHKSPKDKPS